MLSTCVIQPHIGSQIILHVRKSHRFMNDFYIVECAADKRRIILEAMIYNQISTYLVNTSNLMLGGNHYIVYSVFSAEKYPHFITFSV